MKNNGLKNAKAITLIAMVVTIIVLLILAGVSIAVLTGENGILNRATSAKQTNEQKTAEEELKLGVSALSIDYRKNSTNAQTFREFVTSNSGANLKTAMGLETTNTDLIIENAANGVLSYKGQKYQVDDFGGIAEYVPMWVQNKTQVSKDGVTLEVGQAVTGYSVTANVEGTEKTIGDGNWYVLGAKDGKLLITTNTCPEQVTLSGKDGYTGGVALLNFTAEKYTNLQLADGNARSINVDDINRVTGYDPNIAKYNSEMETSDQWDNYVTYTYSLDEGVLYYKGTKYPICENEQRGVKTSAAPFVGFEYWNGNDWIDLGINENPTTSKPIRDTGYVYFPNTLTASSSTSEEIAGIATNSLAYILLFSNTGYLDFSSGYPPTLITEEGFWLGNQTELCTDGYARFGIRCVERGKVGLWSLFHSSHNSDEWVEGIRPVITLASDVQVSSTGVITK